IQRDHLIDINIHCFLDVFLEARHFKANRINSRLHFDKVVITAAVGLYRATDTGSIIRKRYLHIGKHCPSRISDPPQDATAGALSKGRAETDSKSHHYPDQQRYSATKRRIRFHGILRSSVRGLVLCAFVSEQAARFDRLKLPNDATAETIA